MATRAPIILWVRYSTTMMAFMCIGWAFWENMCYPFMLTKPIHAPARTDNLL